MPSFFSGALRAHTSITLRWPSSRPSSTHSTSTGPNNRRTHRQAHAHAHAHDNTTATLKQQHEHEIVNTRGAGCEPEHSRRHASQRVPDLEHPRRRQPTVHRAPLIPGGRRHAREVASERLSAPRSSDSSPAGCRGRTGCNLRVVEGEAQVSGGATGGCSAPSSSHTGATPRVTTKKTATLLGGGLFIAATTTPRAAAICDGAWPVH